MPTTRRRRQTARRDAPGVLDARARARLVSGHDWAGLLDGPDRNDDELRVLWRRHRDELVGARGPGRRAWGWWAFEAKEPRRRLHKDAPRAVAGGGLWFGVSRFLTGMPMPGDFETELAYLERLDLLAPGEKAAALEAAEVADRPRRAREAELQAAIERHREAREAQEAIEDEP